MVRILDARSACSDCLVVAAAALGVGLGAMAFACSGPDVASSTSLATVSEAELRDIAQRYDASETGAPMGAAQHSVECLRELARSQPVQMSFAAP